MSDQVQDGYDRGKSSRMQRTSEASRTGTTAGFLWWEKGLYQTWCFPPDHFLGPHLAPPPSRFITRCKQGETERDSEHQFPWQHFHSQTRLVPQGRIRDLTGEDLLLKVQGEADVGWNCG